MSPLPTLLTQMKNLKPMARDARRGDSDLLGKATGSQYRSLLAGRPSHEDPRNFQTSLTACAAGLSGEQRKAESKKKFSSQPPNPALSALEFYRARQGRIVSRNDPFEV